MNLRAILDPRGRLSRAGWWLRVVALMAVWVIVGGIWFAVLSRVENGLGMAYILSALLSLISVVVLVTVGIARLHDRDKSGWWLILFYGVPTWLNGVSGNTWQGAPTTIIDAGFAVAGFAISIWGLVELGFLRGTRGPNRFGADPLD